VRITQNKVRGRPGLAIAALAAMAGLAIAGCGGSDSSTSSSTSAETTSSTTAAGGGGGGGGASSTVAFSETEYKIDPSDPSVNAGQVTFKVTNDGQITHNLEIEGPAEEQELKQDLAPGASGSMTVDLSQPGKYEFYCPIDGHRDQGMEGEITVK
jgi:uncharacterized cupredoxin-like copper-binding protein